MGSDGGGLHISLPYQHVEVLPEVLRHESEESQKGPAEAVEAGVAVVWIPPSFHARVSLWAAAVRDNESALLSKLTPGGLQAQREREGEREGQLVGVGVRAGGGAG